MLDLSSTCTTVLYPHSFEDADRSSAGAKCRSYAQRAQLANAELQRMSGSGRTTHVVTAPRKQTRELAAQLMLTSVAAQRLKQSTFLLGNFLPLSCHSMFKALQLLYKVLALACLCRPQLLSWPGFKRDLS